MFISAAAAAAREMHVVSRGLPGNPVYEVTNDFFSTSEHIEKSENLERTSMLYRRVKKTWMLIHIVQDYTTSMIQ